MLSKTSSLLFLTILWLFTSCDPDNPQPNQPTSNSTTVSWQANIDGVSYSYSGTYVNGVSSSTNDNNPGDSNFNGGINLRKGTIGGDLIYIAIAKYPLAVGNYTITSTSGGAIGGGVTISKNNITIGHSYYPNTNINLTITEYPEVGGLIKGNFSGVIGTSQTGGGTMPISGQFVAYRIL
jgi:hypothetical protein